MFPYTTALQVEPFRLKWQRIKNDDSDEDYEITIGGVWMRISKDCGTHWRWQSEYSQKFVESKQKAEEHAIRHLQKVASEYANQLYSIRHALNELRCLEIDD